MPIGVGTPRRSTTWRSFAMISSGLCRFLDINRSSKWPKTIHQGGPLLRGQTRHAHIGGGAYHSLFRSLPRPDPPHASRSIATIGPGRRPGSASRRS